MAHWQTASLEHRGPIFTDCTRPAARPCLGKTALSQDEAVDKLALEFANRLILLGKQ